jgi:hypothetical protein
MNPALLLAHFERVANAPDAIPRLRRFILNLAVRGKLVPQDPSDEPASKALQRIATLPKPAKYERRSVELIPGTADFRSTTRRRNYHMVGSGCRW